MSIARSATPSPEATLHEEYADYDKKHKRHGHDKDIVDDNDVRQVAGCLPLDMKTRRVLLISSSKNKDAWVLPKGGWEQDETKQHAAQRETWEEAGIKGTITRDLGLFEERTNKKKILKAHHWIFEMEIDDVKKKFPEKKKRERRWFTFEEAIIATQDHRYIQEAILKSSLNPSKSSPTADPVVYPISTKAAAKLKPIVNPIVNSPQVTKPISKTLGSPPTTPSESVERNADAENKQRESALDADNQNKYTPVVNTDISSKKEEAVVSSASINQNQVQPVSNTDMNKNQDKDVPATADNMASMSIAADQAKPKKSFIKSIKSIFN